jgi:hypothetical protein
MTTLILAGYRHRDVFGVDELLVAVSNPQRYRVSGLLGIDRQLR